MSELSIFIDESGDFGEYDPHSPYYIISMVFHNQASDISEPLEKLNTNLRNINYPDHCVHTGPIIRRENEYEFESIENRRRIFNFMITFVKANKKRLLACRRCEKNRTVFYIFIKIIC